jgi:hypothetical protein
MYMTLEDHLTCVWLQITPYLCVCVYAGHPLWTQTTPLHYVLSTYETHITMPVHYITLQHSTSAHVGSGGSQVPSSSGRELCGLRNLFSTTKLCNASCVCRARA